MTHSVDRAQHLFDGFVFNCDCDACTQDWPLFDLLPAGNPADAAVLESVEPVNISGYKSV